MGPVVTRRNAVERSYQVRANNRDGMIVWGIISISAVWCPLFLGCHAAQVFCNLSAPEIFRPLNAQIVAKAAHLHGCSIRGVQEHQITISCSYERCRCSVSPVREAASESCR